jgi:hypothetical protein
VGTGRHRLVCLGSSTFQVVFMGVIELDHGAQRRDEVVPVGALRLTVPARDAAPIGVAAADPDRL